jgi:excisionase family DNA binding protein
MDEITREIITNDWKLMKASEVAERLRIKQSTVYRLWQTGELPSIRIGGSIRMAEHHLSRYIEHNHRNGRDHHASE